MVGSLVDVGQTVSFVVKSNAKTQGFFSDKLYQDKIRAAIREILHNGRDAQIENGNGDEPLHIHFPTVAEPFFAVTDNGIGMSHDFMVSTFVTYSESTKDDPQARFEAVGKLGLGSKSPFAVADEFFVTSRFDGVKTAYRLFKTADGNSMDVLSSERTDARNGVEVRWAVFGHKFAEYRSALSKVLTYFEPPPEITGAAADFTRDYLDIAFEGDGYRVMNSDRHAYDHRARAVMGGIIYPIDTTQIPGLTENEQAVLSLTIDIDFPLGAIDFDIGREALSYDDAVTRPAIKRRLVEVFKDMRARVDADYKVFPTFFEAAQHLVLRKATSQGYAKVVGVVGARWRKRDISDGGFKVKLTDYKTLGGISYKFYYKHSGSSNLSRFITRFGGCPISAPATADVAEHFFVPAIPNLMIFRDDMDTGAGVRFQDALRRFQCEGLFIALIRCSDDDFSRLQAELEGVEIRSIQDVERPEPKRYKASVRVLGGRARETGEITKDTLCPADIDMDGGGLYVNMKMNHVIDRAGNTDVQKWHGDLNAKRFGTRYKACVINGLFSLPDENLVFVPSSLADTFAKHPKWKLAWDELDARAEALLEDPQTKVTFTKGVQFRSFAYDETGRTLLASNFELVLSHLPDGHAFKDVAAMAGDYCTCDRTAENLGYLFAAFVGGSVENHLVDLGATLYQRYQDVLAKYPLLMPSMNGAPSFRGHWNDGKHDDQEKERVAYYRSVAEYVLLLDGASGPSPTEQPAPTRRAVGGRARFGAKSFARASKRRGIKSSAHA